MFCNFKAKLFKANEATN